MNKVSQKGISQRQRQTSLGNTSCDVSVHSLVTASLSLLGICALSVCLSGSESQIQSEAQDDQQLVLLWRSCITTQSYIQRQTREFGTTVTLPKGPSSEYFHEGNANPLGSFFHACTKGAVYHTHLIIHICQRQIQLAQYDCHAKLPQLCADTLINVTVRTAENCTVGCLNNPEASVN